MYKLIKCGKLYDGIKNELQEDMEILVKDNMIEKVGKTLEHPEETEIIDLSNLQITPGMIDAHVHPMFFDWKSLFTSYHTFNDDYLTLATLHTAQKGLERGFTTQRIMTGSCEGYGSIEVKKQIENGNFKGARLVVAPQILASEGSHGDFSVLVKDNPNVTNAMQMKGIGSGPDFFTKMVREQIRHGADFIKIIATGGFATPQDTPEEQQMNDSELKAIIETTNNIGRTVTAHAYVPKFIKKLVDFGITGIEHGALMDKDTAKLMADKDVYCVPTFCPYDEIIRLDEEKLAKKPLKMQEKLRHYQKQLIESREIIIDSNITLGMGTDHIAVHQSYEGWYEYESWLLSGIDPFRALKAATSNNAKILQRNDIGSIEPGKKADIAGWCRDLVKDPTALQECSFVMKDGEVYETTISN
jgi:imidazolonepropionase-like amidohydrolase